MATETAQVQALTAEVRVLMVGNRQVTLSVFEQLDTVHYSDIEPFGRVRPKRGKYHYAFERVDVVGRSKRDDGLVRSHIVDDIDDDDIDKPPIQELLSTFLSWRDDLPLIVLAGLR